MITIIMIVIILIIIIIVIIIIKSPTIDKTDKNIYSIIVLKFTTDSLKYSNNEFLNRSVDLMLTIALGNASQSLTVV